MAKVRKDNKGRNLRPGETQRADGSYMYVYKLGTKKKYLYDSDLASLRVKEKQINKDKDDGIRTQEAMKLTLNDMFKVYMNNNIKLKPSTRANYLYLWDFYVKEEPPRYGRVCASPAWGAAQNHGSPAAKRGDQPRPAG